MSLITRQKAVSGKYRTRHMRTRRDGGEVGGEGEKRNSAGILQSIASGHSCVKKMGYGYRGGVLTHPGVSRD